VADYEFLTVENIPDYLRTTPAVRDVVDVDDLASCEEIGDGNLNLVFLVKDGSGRGVCLKQALPYVRMTGEGWPMTPDRARHEAEALTAHGALVPDLVPRLYHYDPHRHIIAMEDLSDHRVWRGALNDGLSHVGAAEAVGRYVGAVAFGTSALGMDREALADAVARSVNPQLCEITEDLVFTEPLVDAGRNSCLPANEPDAADFSADDAMMRAMGHAKWLFMTKAEALVHGDLHTGSVMVRGAGAPDAHGRVECDSVRCFDSEFAFYGPLAFDLGAPWANYVAAAARAFALGEDTRADWCLSLVSVTWDAFETEFRRRWPDRRDPRVWTDATLADLLLTWRSEAWLFAAAKMSRRIVGAAKNTDVETLPPELREGAARGILRLSRQVVREAGVESSPQAFSRLARQVLLENRTR